MYDNDFTLSYTYCYSKRFEVLFSFKISKRRRISEFYYTILRLIKLCFIHVEAHFNKVFCEADPFLVLYSFVEMVSNT